MMATPLGSLAPALERARLSLTRGEPILLFDAPEREGETDLVILSERASPELVRLLRRDAGGLLCVAISDELRRRLGLPFFAELLAAGEGRFPALAGLVDRPRYDRHSAFGITINHRATYTGISDRERALTIKTLGEIARAAPSLSDGELGERFSSAFGSPGHVPLIYAAPGLLSERKGHTELVISLARMAHLGESLAVCEMLGDSGGPRSLEAARRYAEEHGWPFLDGKTLVEAWRTWSA